MSPRIDPAPHPRLHAKILLFTAFFLVPCLLFGEGKSDSQLQDLEHLAFMVGSWRADNDNSVMEELWMPARGNMMLGLSRQVSARGTHWEFLRIEQTDNSVVYWASPGGQSPTPFKLVQVGKARAVFSNPEHDFPQRIVYTREGDRLHARVEAGSGDEMKGFDLHWQLATTLD